MSSKTPHGTANTAGRFAYQGLVLTGLKLFVKPLANAMSHNIGCDGQNRMKEDNISIGFHPLPQFEWSRKADTYRIP